MIAFMLSSRNMAGVQFSHKTTEKLIVFSESLSVGQLSQPVRTVPSSTGEKATIDLYVATKQLLRAHEPCITRSLFVFEIDCHPDGQHA